MRTSALSRGFLLACLVALVIFALGLPKAYANDTVFPPDHCTAASPFMGWTGAGNTFCDTGQDVFLNALPNCTADQQVVFNGSKFICQDMTSLPTCGAGQFLTSTDGKTYTCQNINAPTCPSGQVLTYVAGNGFTCVNPNAPVPTCGSGQFLTYNGAGFQCASVPVQTFPTIPVCNGTGQSLQYDGTNFQCVSVTASVQTTIVTVSHISSGNATITASCPSGYVVTGGGWSGGNVLSGMGPSGNSGWSCSGAGHFWCTAVCALGQ